jgi:triosephosphate isomerase (TIM)
VTGRRPIVAGNWKMNPPSRDEAVRLATGVADAADGLEAVTTVVCPPAIWLTAVAEALSTRRVAVGAQTMHHADAGAFTGEISPAMLGGVATHVIIGHSERRQYDGETDEGVALKVASAVAHGLVPIAAIGERADERRAGATSAVIDRQLRAAISRLDGLGGTGLVIAYEPVWAIGTGDAASAEDAQSVAAQVRAILREIDAAEADAVPIQYGGSVTADNAEELFAQPDIDGALVGGASLKPDVFAAIVHAADRSAHQRT